MSVSLALQSSDGAHRFGAAVAAIDSAGAYGHLTDKSGCAAKKLLWASLPRFVGWVL